ncbi:hypothetical protein [Psychromonas sp. GE-S-Ul-11]|uniref:hypothetical protein n=2 Tax=unclassified Psychromonas TaxID=2614957 RepID=UPI00390CB2A2
MKLKKCYLRLFEMGCLGLLPSIALANDLPSSVSESYVSFGLSHTQSDNITQSNSNKQSGYEQQADLGVGYFNQTATNRTALDYSAYYTTYSEDSLDNEGDVSGSLSISQQLFSKNLTLNLTHFRRSYLLDEAGLDVPENTGDRDVFTINPVWVIPYSSRAGIELDYDFTATRYTDDDDQDTNRHGVGVTWYNELSAKARLEVATDVNKVEYLSSNFDYTQTNVNASIDGKLREGLYLVQLGYSHLTSDQGDEGGAIFKLSYSYQFSRQSLSLTAQRELSDSSLGSGNDVLDNSDESASDDAEIQWVDRVDLQHQFFITNRLSNSNTLYYQQETEIVSDDVEPRWGASTYFSLQTTKKMNTFLSVGYSESTVNTNFDKQAANATLGSSYAFRPHLSFSLQANYYKQSVENESNSYDEMQYTASVEFKY